MAAPPDDAWFNSRWRPAMAWQYLAVCLFDFMVAPVMIGLYSMYAGEFHAWEPLTIRGGGLYHVAMGAIVGVTSWSRGKEKMLMLNNSDGDDTPKTNDRAEESK